MDTAPLPGDIAAGNAAALTAKQRQVAWEARGIAEARADIAAGRVVDSAEVDARIDSLDTDHELPVPISGR